MAEATKEIAIGDKDNKLNFTVPQPYTEGHQCSAIEAKVLNQSFGENIGNNIRGMIKKFLNKEEGAHENEAALRADVDAKIAAYQFTESAAKGTSRTMTPEQKEANKIAREWLMGKLKEAGYTRKSYEEAKAKEGIEDAFAVKVSEIAETEKVQKLAAANIKRAQAALDDLQLGEAA